MRCRAFVGTAESGISLELDPVAKRFNIMESHQRGEHSVDINTVAKGTYSFKGNLLVMKDSLANEYSFEVINSLIMKAQFKPEKPLPSEFMYCSCMYHKNGVIAWEGIWRDGLKDNLWFFYDTKGKHVKTVFYERGMPKKVRIDPTYLPDNG